MAFPCEYAQAGPDSMGSGFDGFGSAPCQTTCDPEWQDPFFLDDYTNTTTYREQPLPVFSHPTYPDGAFPFPDPTLQYDATVHAQNTVIAPCGSFTPEQPATLFAQYMPQDAPYPASYTLPQNIDPSAVWWGNTAFAPLLPANLPHYPASQPSMLPPQDVHEQHENRAIHASPTAAPSMSTSPVVPPGRKGKQKRKVEAAAADPPPKKRAKSVKFKERYPHIPITTFSIVPSLRNTPIPRTVKPSPAPPQLIPPPQPAPQLQATQPASFPVALAQVPTGSIPSVSESMMYTPPVSAQRVRNHLAFIRVDRLLYGRNNQPLPKPLPKGVKLVISLYRGTDLEARRQREGPNFYGNEMFDTRTGARCVLRIMDFDDARDVLRSRYRVRVEPGAQFGAGQMPLETVPHESTVSLPSLYNAGQNIEEPPVTSIQNDLPAFTTFLSPPGLPIPAMDDASYPSSSTSVASELQDPTIPHSVQYIPDNDLDTFFSGLFEDSRVQDPFFQSLDPSLS